MVSISISNVDVAFATTIGIPTVKTSHDVYLTIYSSSYGDILIRTLEIWLERSGQNSIVNVYGIVDIDVPTGTYDFKLRSSQFDYTITGTMHIDVRPVKLLIDVKFTHIPATNPYISQDALANVIYSAVSHGGAPGSGTINMEAAGQYPGVEIIQYFTECLTGDPNNDASINSISIEIGADRYTLPVTHNFIKYIFDSFASQGYPLDFAEKLAIAYPMYYRRKGCGLILISKLST